MVQGCQRGHETSRQLRVTYAAIEMGDGRGRRAAFGAVARASILRTRAIPMMRFSRRVRSRPRVVLESACARTCETRVPRLKAADLPALTATGEVSEAMADMVAGT